MNNSILLSKNRKSITILKSHAQRSPTQPALHNFYILLPHLTSSIQRRSRRMLCGWTKTYPIFVDVQKRIPYFKGHLTFLYFTWQTARHFKTQHKQHAHLHGMISFYDDIVLVLVYANFYSVIILCRLGTGNPSQSRRISKSRARQCTEFPQITQALYIYIYIYIYIYKEYCQS